MGGGGGYVEVFHISSKDESPDRYDTSFAYISRQFGLKKTDGCNKHQDLSVHW
jgi:hypothetical protein